MLSEIPKGFEKLSGEQKDRELLRIGLIAELDAINLYEQLASESNSKHIRELFKEIAGEEKTHVGEFLELLKKLDKEQVEELVKGAEEVAELMEK